MISTDPRRVPITIRLDGEAKIAFEQYAIDLGIDAAAIAQLLFARELRIRRLLSLKEKNQLPSFARQAWGKGIERPTITTKYRSSTERDQFDRYAQSCGLSRQAAGEWLLLKELEDRWLESALGPHLSD
jgi:hypothetical protein